MPDRTKSAMKRKKLPSQPMMHVVVMDSPAEQMQEYARIMDDPRFTAAEREHARKMALEMSRKVVRRRGR